MQFSLRNFACLAIACTALTVTNAMDEKPSSAQGSIDARETWSDAKLPTKGGAWA